MQTPERERKVPDTEPPRATPPSRPPSDAALTDVDRGDLTTEGVWTSARWAVEPS